ncbi:MAG: sigma-70 family RNA polymerase sigma factor [Chthoniobacterales bacterium]|nr:sigma-70 family RNA polymerase sigma factor [Chthoniobacterales bacterium]
MSDAEILSQLVSGDETGFWIFYARFSATLFSLIRHILWDAQEAEEALQDAFTQMWKNSSRFDPARGTLFSWAVAIARNKALDRLRRARRHQRIYDCLAEERSAAELQAKQFPASGLMESDERGRVRAALVLLSSAEREVIELAFFSGMTHVEISRKLLLPLGTTKARIRRGLLTLRHAFEVEERTTENGLRDLQPV